MHRPTSTHLGWQSSDSTLSTFSLLHAPSGRLTLSLSSPSLSLQYNQSINQHVLHLYTKVLNLTVILTLTPKQQLSAGTSRAPVHCAASSYSSTLSRQTKGHFSESWAGNASKQLITTTSVHVKTLLHLHAIPSLTYCNGRRVGSIHIWTGLQNLFAS